MRGENLAWRLKPNLYLYMLQASERRGETNNGELAFKFPSELQNATEGYSYKCWPIVSFVISALITAAKYIYSGLIDIIDASNKYTRIAAASPNHKPNVRFIRELNHY